MLENSLDLQPELQNFDDYFDGMKDAVNKQILNKEELNRFEVAGEENV
jgi:hypothetical protein